MSEFQRGHGQVEGLPRVIQPDHGVILSCGRSNRAPVDVFYINISPYLPSSKPGFSTLTSRSIIALGFLAIEKGGDMQ